MIYIIGPKDKYSIDPSIPVINTTSHSTNWSRGLSPFVLGPCKLYDSYISKNVENGWQYAKVYKEYVDNNDNPTDNYFEWARNGWDNPKAVRYPMGKGSVPLYSYWNGNKLSYIDARKKIYIPLYTNALMNSPVLSNLIDFYRSNKDIALFDFDGYNYNKLGMSINEVVNCESKIMGHGFVIMMFLLSYA